VKATRKGSNDKEINRQEDEGKEKNQAWKVKEEKWDTLTWRNKHNNEGKKEGTDYSCDTISKSSMFSKHTTSIRVNLPAMLAHTMLERVHSKIHIDKI
jgi:hypothetical protein